MCLILTLVKERIVILSNKKVEFYFMIMAEIEYDELTEEINTIKSETLLIDELTLSESEDLSECLDSVTSILNLTNACFALEETPITTKNSRASKNIDSDSSSSSSGQPLSGSSNSNPSVGNTFFYVLFAYDFFNAVDKNLNRGRRRLGPLA